VVSEIEYEQNIPKMLSFPLFPTRIGVYELV